MCVFSHSVMSDSFVTPWAVAPPGYSVRGIFPARILEWVTIFSSYWHAISHYMFCAFTLNSYLIIYKLSGQRTLSLFEVSIISECCWCWTGFLSGASCEEFACHAGDPRNVGLTPGSGRSGEGNGSHSSTLAWKIPWTEVSGRLQSARITKSWTRLSI